MRRPTIATCVAVLTTILPFTAAAQSAGPYSRLVIRDAMVIPGHGGPPYGPADIIIENDTIVQIISMNGVTGRPAGQPPPEGDRVIDANGMVVMPGLIDLHTHIRTEPLPLQYIYNLKLAHGVTTMVNGAGRGFREALAEARRSEVNEIKAPRMFPIRDWGPSRSRDPGHAPPLDEIEMWHDPAKATELAAELMSEGAYVIRVGSLAWNAELFGADCEAVAATFVPLTRRTNICSSSITIVIPAWTSVTASTGTTVTEALMPPPEETADPVSASWNR